MGVAFLPLYIQYIGIEAYGLIGLFAVLQAFLGLLDMGMTPTLNREMARFASGAHTVQSIRDLLRSLELVCYGFAALIAFSIWAISGYLASSWLKSDQLSTDVVAQALAVMALVVALRFCEGIYRGSLLGLQQQVWFNGANALLSTLRYGGAGVVLAWVSPTIEAYFLWQAIISLVTLAVFATKLYHTLPKAASPAKFRRTALTEIWRFAGAMMGLTFLAIMSKQIDKVMLSNLLTLENYGYYIFAAIVAGVISIIVGPVTLALYPRMTELATCLEQERLVRIYHQGAQLVTVLIAPATMLLICFPYGVIYMWSGNTGLAEHVAPILSVLVIGTFLNGLLWMPHHFQLAHGWTSLALKVNIIAVSILVPTIIFIVPKYGVVGAAWAWVALNFGHVLISVQFMHRRLIPDEKWRWYYADVLLPMLGSIIVVYVANAFRPAESEDRWLWLVFLLVTGFIALAFSMLLAGHIRARFLAMFKLRSSRD